MRLSNRFKELRRRLTELRNHMLPSSFSATGDYTERQQDRARGYRLLAHAEFESYLEDVSREVITRAVREWKRNKRPTQIIVSFLASFHSSWSVSDELNNEQIIELAKKRNIKDSVDEIINLAQNQFARKLKDNHGVKDKNFKTLILPTGVDISALDPTWLTSLDSFGAKRGEVAHNTKRVQGSINPRDEYDLVRNLLSGFESLDREVQTIALMRV
ncbi:HEPN domain-containing protein [Pseudohongiella acticola]|jgi:RiboL-PSP-HEPN|uniref:HEPN domain-containing protein n=1 Tax=Pseudohongiella acticola TaxID=1524254 RepID=UPI0030EE3369